MRPLGLALLPLPALALSPVEAFRSDLGHLYVEVELAEGVAIRSTEAVTYHVGAAMQELAGVETITFRDDCSAASTLLGEGAWSRDWQGVRVGFLGLDMTFERAPGALAAGCGG